MTMNEFLDKNGDFISGRQPMNDEYNKFTSQRIDMNLSNSLSLISLPYAWYTKNENVIGVEYHMMAIDIHYSMPPCVFEGSLVSYSKRIDCNRSYSMAVNKSAKYDVTVLRSDRTSQTTTASTL